MERYFAQMENEWLKRLQHAVQAELDSGAKETEIARRCGVNRSWIDDLMRKGSRPRVDVFLKVCDGLGVDPQEILTGVKQGPEASKILRAVYQLTPEQRGKFLDLLGAIPTKDTSEQ